MTMHSMDDLSPRKVTKIPVPHSDDVIEVSSVHYNLRRDEKVVASLNETCVFFPDGESDIRGTYADHDKVVAEIMGA